VISDDAIRVFVYDTSLDFGSKAPEIAVLEVERVTSKMVILKRPKGQMQIYRRLGRDDQRVHATWKSCLEYAKGCIRRRKDHAEGTVSRLGEKLRRAGLLKDPTGDSNE